MPMTNEEHVGLWEAGHREQRELASFAMASNNIESPL